MGDQGVTRGPGGPPHRNPAAVSTGYAQILSIGRHSRESLTFVSHTRKLLLHASVCCIFIRLRVLVCMSKGSIEKCPGGRLLTTKRYAGRLIDIRVRFRGLVGSSLRAGANPFNDFWWYQYKPQLNGTRVELELCSHIRLPGPLGFQSKTE